LIVAVGLTTAGHLSGASLQDLAVELTGRASRPGCSLISIGIVICAGLP